MCISNYESLLESVQNASWLAGGEIGSGPGFSRDDVIRVVLAFPDVYEIGISNEALQILYHVARTANRVEVERTYLPWVDAISALRARDIPLLTLETWTPVASAHVLGITLQHELNYTNVLELLHLAGIPLRASQRRSDSPIVIGGGPAVANFLPVAPFFDAIVVGDGEVPFSACLRTLAQAILDEGLGREEALNRLASIPGVFVFGHSKGVERQVLSRLEGAPYPEQPIVPLASGVHNRAWVEVMRGCTRGCRFCQAGMWYRPVRERKPLSVLRMAEAQIAATGYDEVALGSLSTTDYSALECLLAELSRRLPEVTVALPSLRVDSAAVRLSHLASPRAASLTLAPEAGSQRLRNVINKNVTDDDVLSAAREAYLLGYKTIKLYFMIGLPGESDEDVEAIVDLCHRVAEVGKRLHVAHSSRLSVHVSVTNFVPKPFTPFQWEGMESRANLERRQSILRKGLRRSFFSLALHSIDTSYLEAALARGGEEMADVIEEAWRRGARFDSWNEHLRLDAWEAAFAILGVTAEQLATRRLEPQERLPWDVITGPVVKKEYLLEERRRALRAESTPDCRFQGCTGCGVCDHIKLTLDLASEPASEEFDVAAQKARGSHEQSGIDEAVSYTTRYLLEFSVSGRLRFLSHLDTMEVLRRAVRRTGARLSMSQGMRPKPKLAILLPKPVGVEGLRELAELEVRGQLTSDFVERLNKVLPQGVRAIRIEDWRYRGSAAARVTGCWYEVTVSQLMSPVGDDFCIRLAEAAAAFQECESLMVSRRLPKGVKTVDVRRYVTALEVIRPDERQAEEDTCRAVIRFRTKVARDGAVRPWEVVQAMSALSGVQLCASRIVRTRVDLEYDETKEK